jgi:CubicO group peptidase (beta-lactamase class C family)
MSRSHHSLARPVVLLLLLLAAACATHSPPPEPEPPLDVAERIRRVETGLLTHHVVRGEARGLAIEERMRFHRVPGVSVAVIDGGRIAWARAWGETEAGSGMPVDTATLFQAASISKPVAAAGALRLVEEGLLALDEDVNLRLRSWKVPENGFTASERVTLRRLLSHSAGTTVHGFPGYAAGSAVPTLVQLLNGEPPANTPAVQVNLVPGSRWRYSGGGTSVVQLLMSDVTERPFADWMGEHVLQPAGMRHSTYEQPLPASRLAQAATGHRRDGTPIPGRHHAYPEQAAAGLWTTPSDLARFAIEIQRAYTSGSGRILSPQMARRMLTLDAGDYGLGFGLEGKGDELWFQHGGSNAGFQSFFAALGARGQGAVVMTNGDAGGDLAIEILRAIAREYGMPGFAATEREVVRIEPAVLAAHAGEYVPAGAAPQGLVVRLRVEGGHLHADVPRLGWAGRPLRAGPEGVFFFLENGGEFAFERDVRGRVVGAVLTGLGEPLRLVRR